jgi:calcineurin-like phosphoesterase family protein
VETQINKEQNMTELIQRRDFLKLAGMGVAVFVSGPAVLAGGSPQKRNESFYFVQLSDTHWGFNGPAINPDSQGTLKKAVAAVNGLDEQPDFVVFTGDLTQTTDDRKIRRDRMAEFRDIVSQLKVKTVRFMPGEHDASLDRGEAYQEFFGDPYYTFDHEGVHFIVLDNVSDPMAAVGEKQLQWLQSDLKQIEHDARIVVLTHRPLFDLAPEWDWATRDGAAVIDALMPHPNVTVLYGHIHQEHHHMTGHIAHHAAKSLMWALPEPGSVPRKAQIPWNSAEPYKGLGFREIESEVRQARYDIKEFSMKG